MKFSDFNNLYEVRKAVRFELIPIQVNNNKKPLGDGIVNLEIVYEKLKNLINSHEKFVNNLGKTFFIKEEKRDNPLSGQGELEKHSKKEENASKIADFSEYDPNPIIQFKHGGLEKAFRNKWIEKRKAILYTIKDGVEKKKNKTYITLTELGDNNFVKIFFEKFLEENRKINNTLQKFLSGKHNLSRLSDLSFEVQKLNSRDLLGKLYILFEGEYITHKNDNDIIQQLGTKLQELKNSIQALLELTRPSQSFGIPLEHITLNYYTRNKTPKGYDEADSGIEEEALEKPYNKDLGELYGIKKDQPIKSLYKEMKLFKARQKSAFLEQLKKGVVFGDLTNPFNFIDFQGEEYKNFEQKLFADIEPKKNYETGEIEKTAGKVYNYLVSLTKDIEKETDKIERKKLKEKRGKYFQNHFKKYKDFCENYKKVAMEYGKRNAKVLSLKREKLLAERERGRGFISEKYGKHFLNIIPSENAQEVLKKLGKNSNGEITYYLLSSITLRALDKLCFKKDASFAKQVKSQLNDKFKEKKSFEGGILINIKSKKQLIEENILLEFYNDVLEKQNTLKITYRAGENSKTILKNAKTEEEFEIALKQETYTLEEKKITERSLDNILREYHGNSYEITSWDLRGSGSRFEKDGDTHKIVSQDIRKERNKPEEYTKYWFEFWNNENKKSKYLTRINPEILISFVRKTNGDWNENNRRNRNRYILTSTFSYFTDKKYIDNAFINDKERKESIKSFNELYNKKYSHQYFYGLDRGTDELITLGIYKKGESGIIPIHLDKVEMYNITGEGLHKTKSIKNKNGEEKLHTLYKNPSMFLELINDNAVFEKQEIISCLGNLTAAKLIDRKIILNGDINTVKKLYEINAKRQLYIAITEGKCISTKIGFNEEEKTFYYEYENRGRPEPKNIYTINDIIAPITTKEEIEQLLNEYIENVKNNMNLEDISIQKINNLKNAICANIVGIIMKLQKFYDGCFVWESLSNDTTNQHLSQQNTDLGNTIIEKIYNKLQFSKQVPPILKKFRSDIIDGLQHGKALYVSESETSSQCPNCDGKLGGHLTEFENEMKHFSDVDYDKAYDEYPKFKKENTNRKGKKKPNKYSPGKDCDFYIGNPKYTEYSFIHSGNDLATYNIAKKRNITKRGKGYRDL